MANIQQHNQRHGSKPVVTNIPARTVKIAAVLLPVVTAYITQNGEFFVRNKR